MSFWKNYMHQRERWYHQRDNNRLVRPLDWGLKYIVDHVNGDDPRELFRQHTDRVMQSSEEFYALPEITDYVLEGDQLTWTSAIQTPSAENNIAHARFFPAKNKTANDRETPSSFCRSGTHNLKATSKPAASSTSSACPHCG